MSSSINLSGRAKDDATRLISLLPAEQAKAAVENVADITNPEVIDPNLDRPPDYQRPPDEVARWMVSLPVELWNESIGKVAQEWLHQDPFPRRIGSINSARICGRLLS